ncbi:MAG: glutamate--tRNA ligase [Patescibacteria group bacterium]
MAHKTDTHQPIVTRFAPSPTGFLHIGSARTALYAYLFARQQGGQFILRIEDTDKAREVTGAIEHIKESLTWLGLDWDYGPDIPGPFGSCIQSDRLDLYRQYATWLWERGLAYPDPFTKEEVETFRAQAQTEKRPFLFRDHRPETVGEWDGVQPLRFRVPEIKRYSWTDVVRGELSGGAEMLDDFVILKGDGYPTYSFAHIVDDHEMAVTHVMRGDEFIASMPKFLSLYDALEIPWPTFVTLPPIMGPDGKKKLSKRDGAKDLLEYRTDGILPETMRNFLALIGWNPGGDRELLYATAETDELRDAFDLTRIQRSGGAFNAEKLVWMNGEHLKRQSRNDQVTYVHAALEPADPLIAERITKLAPTILERYHTHQAIRDADGAGEFDWMYEAPNYDTNLLKWKHDEQTADALPRLRHVHTLLTNADFSSPDTLKDTLWEYAEATGKGEVLWPLRVALSGKERSPDPFTLLYVLGEEASLARIDAACAKIEA